MKSIHLCILLICFTACQNSDLEQKTNTLLFQDTDKTTKSHEIKIELSEAKRSAFHKKEISLLKLAKTENKSMDKMRSDRLKLKDELRQTLNIDSSFLYHFDSLKHEILIEYSSDSLFRSFSWDLVSGGTWHDYAVLAQIKNDSLSKIKSLSTGLEARNGKYTDAAVYQIHPIQIENQKAYLCFSFGTHGSGHHHKIAQIFMLKNNRLRKCNSCFSNQKDITVVSARRHKIQLEYNQKKRIISHAEYLPSSNSGFLEPTGKMIYYELKESGFVRKTDK